MGNIKYIFKSLYSNQAVLDGRKKKWPFTLAFFLLGVFLAWIPILVSGYQTNASAFITQTANYEIDKGLLLMSQEESFKALSVAENNGKYILSMDKTVLDAHSSVPSAESSTTENIYENEYNNTNVGYEMAKCFYSDGAARTDGHDGLMFNAGDYANTNGTTGLVYDFYFDALLTDAEQMDPGSNSSTSSSSNVTYENTGLTYFLLVYYFPDLEMESNLTERMTYINNFIATVVLDINSTNTAYNNYPHSFLIMTRDRFFLTTYPLRSSTSNSAGTSYSHGIVNDAVVALKGEAGDTLYSLLYPGDDIDPLDRICSFFNAGNRGAVIYSTWFNIMIICCVYAGLIIVASLGLLFLNKRRTSIYRDTTYWECIKEAVAFAFSPCIIAMIAGFFGGFEFCIGALVLGVLCRLIFSSNKISPPASTDNKPLYQARS